MNDTVLPANYTMPAFTPQSQSITALWLLLILPSHLMRLCILASAGFFVVLSGVNRLIQAV